MKTKPYTDAVDDACRLDQSTAAGGDQLSQGRAKS